MENAEAIFAKGKLIAEFVGFELLKELVEQLAQLFRLNYKYLVGECEEVATVLVGGEVALKRCGGVGK